MAKATWNGAVLAESDTFEEVEGNVYFPRDAVNMDLLQSSDKTTRCGWKGLCSYFHVVVDGAQNKNAGWCYAEPKEAAQNIAGHIAFWKGVVVEK